MLRVSMIGAAAALAMAAAAPAFAQEAASFTMPAYMMVIYPNGRMDSFPLDKKMISEAMAHSHAATRPMMVLVENGKAYLTTDTKMADGKMMSTTLQDYWTWTQRH